MISKAMVGAAQAGNYYSSDDYYTAGIPPTEWFGQAAADLGLSGQPDPDAFKRLLHGELPDGTKVPIHSDRNAALDWTLTPPKSVSIQALVGADPRLVEAHDAAVKAVLERAEKLIGVRTTENGKTTREATAKGIWALVRHETSREGDPNLHTHALLFNLAQRADGQWRAAELKQLFAARRGLDEVYKAELAAAAVRLGYEVRQTANGFELAHVSQQQIDHFSRGAARVEKNLADKGLTRETATSEQKQAAENKGRKKKIHTPRAELQADWQARAKALGLDLSLPSSPPASSAGETESAAMAAVMLAKDHLSEREQAWREADLEQAAMRFGLGKASPKSITAAIERARESGELVEKLDGSLTTPRAIKAEQAVLSVLNRGQKAVERIQDIQTVEQLLKGKSLTAGQAEAVRLLSTTVDRVVGVQGFAGTGKTTMLETFRDLAVAKGFAIVGLAPTTSAVTAMAGSGLDAQTLASWVADPNSAKALNAKSVVLLDECSLVPVQAMKIVLERVEAAGGRVVLLGDQRQYEAVDAGKVFCQLQDAGMKTAAMTEIKRQQTPELLKAAQLAADGKPLEALAKLPVKEIADRGQRHAAIADRYAAMTDAERKETLILTGTRAAKDQINLAVREKLGLGESREIKVFNSRDTSKAERKMAVTYSPGTAVRFETDREKLDLEAGAVAVVSRVERDKVFLRTHDGREIKIQPARMKTSTITLGDVETRQISLGERMRMTGAGFDLESKKYKNGLKGLVSKVTSTQIEITSDRGEKFVLDARLILPTDYGYAATGHSAQGLGADRVLIDREAGSRVTVQRAFYTDLTRGKQAVEIFTDNLDKLTKSLLRESHKTIALDRGGPGGPDDPGRKRQLENQIPDSTPKPAAPAPAKEHDLGLER